MMARTRLLGGRYEVGELLGYGGMGEVHRGRDRRLGRDVAIKTLRADLAREDTFQVRFQREARNVATLNHPAIVGVYDSGDERGPRGETLPYMVMELVDGRTLREVIAAEGALPPHRALEIVAEVCAALDFSHRHGIIHRDIKPANVMLTRTGQVKVMDFGIARALAGHTSALTPPSAVVGSAHYLSPEGARGEEVDERSDVYATGCVLFELLCGHQVFVADNPVSVALRHVREEPPPPSASNPAVSPDVDAVVLRALAKSPLDRYAGAAQMRADLLRAAAGRPVAVAVELSAREAPAADGPPPAPTMSAAEAERALAEVGAAYDRIALLMYTMDGNPGHGFLRGASVSGATLDQQRRLEPRVQQLWAYFAALRETTERARAIRNKRWRLGQQQLAELTRLLRETVVVVDHDGVPLGPSADGPGGADASDAANRPARWLTATALCGRLEQGCAEVTATLVRVATACSALGDRLAALDATLGEARALGEGLGVLPDAALDQATAELTEIRAAALVDPVGAATVQGATVQGATVQGATVQGATVQGATVDGRLRAVADGVAAVRARLAELARVRAAYPTRLESLRRAYDDLAAAENEAREAYAVAEAKIVEPGLPPAPAGAADLGACIADVEDLGRQERWPLVSEALSASEHAVGAALAASRERRQFADGLLARRRELRSRLEAYQVKAGHLGRGEDADATTRYQVAHDLLWRAPCDLRAATRAVFEYQQSLLGVEEAT